MRCCISASDFVQVNGELDAPGIAEMGVSIVEAGHDEGAVQVNDLRRGPFPLLDVGIASRGNDHTIFYRESRDALRLCGFKVHTSQNIPVVVDEVGDWQGLSLSEEGTGNQKKRKYLHSTESIKRADYRPAATVGCA